MLYPQHTLRAPLLATSRVAPLSVPTKILLAVLAIYCHWDALTPYGAPLWTIAYGITLVVVVFLTLLGRRPPHQPAMFWPPVWGFGALVVIGCLTLGQQETIYLKYLLGDVARLLFPLAFIAYGRVSPDLFEHPRSGQMLMLMLFSAAALSPIFSFYFQPYVALLGGVRVTDVGRYDPPHPLLIVLLWYGLLQARGVARRCGAMCLLVAAIALALFSQQRTNALSFLIIGSLVFFVEHRRGSSRSSNVALLLLTAMGLVFLMSVAPVVSGSGSRGTERLDRILSYTRFSKLQGGSDESVAGRFREVEDVWHMFRTSRTLPWLWGLGHGATFTPISSNPLPNLTDGHHVHHIHIGVVQLWFRYGILGVVLLLSLVAGIARALWTLHRTRHPVPVMRRVWTVSLVGGLVVFFVFGTLQDPFLSLAIAGFFSRTPGTLDAGS